MGLAGGGDDQGSPWTNWLSLEALELGGLVVAGAGAAAWALTGNHHASDPTGLNSGVDFLAALILAVSILPVPERSFI